MSKIISDQESRNIKIVTWIGTATLLALLLLFLAITVLSTNRLTSQMKLVAEHPFTVSGDISNVKINLAQMRIRTERLQSYNQPADIEIVDAALNVLYEDMEAQLAEIEELYLGPKEDVEALVSTYMQLKEAHVLFLDYSEQPTSVTDLIADYEEENLYPLYDQLEEDAARILSFVRNTQQNIFTSAAQMSRTVLIWLCTIIAVIVLGLFFFLSVIHKMNLSLYQKNRQFEVLSDTIDETFLIFEKGKNKCDFVSGSADRVLGIPVERLRKNHTLVYQHMKEETAEEISRAMLLESKDSWETVIEYQHPKKLQPCWLQLRSYRIGENGGTKYIVTITDRTEERRSSQALEDALESAQKANKAKKDFLARMSHEIRTPLNAIIGMTTIAAASIEDTEKVESCLEKVSYSSKHLLMLINDVLDMSRIESDRISINAAPFELYQFINSFVSLVYPQATDKGLEFTEKAAGFSEHTIYLGDTLRLNQILLNIVSNAIKFTPKGGKIRLEVERLSSRGNKTWIRFIVQDTGIGMDEEGLSHLYEPFEQADSSIAGKYGGTGLGMSITQNLISMMGGYITVESKKGEGTRFTVELPFEESSVSLEMPRQKDLEHLRVLVVDDEKDICEHAILLLKKMKIHGEWVLSGREAVERVVAGKDGGEEVDVCFIDWKMPDMDGVETARNIRKVVGPDTPIIIISAYDWTDIEKEAREAGVNGFIAKPMFQSAIYNALVNATNGSFAKNGFRKNMDGNSLKGKHLLVAEDNDLNMEIAVKLLEMNGATTESAENGQEALNCFLQTKENHFDAILMDVQMPVMDGCEATRRIRASEHPDAQRIPIIALTANAFEEDVAMVLAAGMNAHIGKPFEISQLCAVLSQT